MPRRAKRRQASASRTRLERAAARRFSHHAVLSGEVKYQIDHGTLNLRAGERALQYRAGQEMRAF